MNIIDEIRKLLDSNTEGVEEPRQEEPKQEEPKQEPKQEEPKPQAEKTEESQPPAEPSVKSPKAKDTVVAPATSPQPSQYTETITDIISKNPNWRKDPVLEPKVRAMFNSKASS